MIQLYILYLAIIFSILKVFWDLRINFFDPFILFVVAIIGGSTFIIVSIDRIGIDNGVYLLCCTLFFLIGYHISISILGRSYKNYLLQFKKFMHESKCDINFREKIDICLTILLVVVVPIYIFFFFQMMSVGIGGAGRLMVSGNYNRLAMILEGCSTIISVLLCFSIVSFGESKYRIMGLIFCFLLLISGSKGALISFGINYLFYHFILNTIRMSYLKVTLWLSMLLLLSMAMITYLNQTDLIDTINLFLYRLLAFGDGYLVAFSNPNIISFMNGFYSIGEFFIHQILLPLKLTVAYDSPGVYMVKILTGNPYGTGPNPVLPMMLAILTLKHYFVSLFISVLLGIISYLIRFLGCMLFSRKHNSIFNVFSIAFFMSSFTIYTDINLYEITFWSLLSSYFLMLLLFNIAYYFKYGRVKLL